MDRFLALTVRALPALLLLACGLPAAAAPATTNAAPSPGLNKVTGAPATPLPPAEDLDRYGKILTPNEHFDAPFKLSMPFPGVGEVTIPSKQELDMRVKLERLATLSNQQIRDQLEKWPAYNNMSLADEGAMLTRIQQFRDRRHQIAVHKAHELGLLTLTPPQMTRFEQEYWDRQLKMDEALQKQFEPVVKADRQQLDADLFRQFSSPRTLAQGPKAPMPKAPAKPAPAPTTASDTMMMH